MTKRISIKALLGIVIFLLFSRGSFPAWGDTTYALESTQGLLRFSFEELRLPQDEKMGLMGGAFLYDINRWFAMGLGSYGAITGERGGFITLGIAAELKRVLNDHLDLNSGLFVGAGGGRGGFTLQGGGLMLRPHLGVSLKTGEWGDVGFGFSHVRFPNGNIRSTQPYLLYAFPFELYISQAWIDKPTFTQEADQALPAAEREISAVYRRYQVPSGVATDGGKPQYSSLDLMGVEWVLALENNLFLKLESEGAMGGRSNGYMQILVGGGYRLKLSEATFAKIATQVGVAGGGSVSTGGGFIYDISLGLQQYVTDALYLGLSGGFVDAPDGRFKATSYSLQLGTRYGVPIVQHEPKRLSSLSDYEWRHLRLRVTHQTYIEGRSTWRSHHADESVDLLGIQMDYFIGENIYLNGQGIGAYDGNAGGYMTGLWGLGYHLPISNTPVFLDLEGLLGAAGGGGLDVAGGLVWQGNIGLGYRLSESLALIGSAGYMSAPKGNFRAKLFGLSLAYHFTLFTK